jgi:hypothetical protein
MADFDLGVLLVRWAEDGPQSTPLAHEPWWYQRFFCDPDWIGVAHYWATQSQGRVRFKGDVFGWFDLIASKWDLRHPDRDTIDRTRVMERAVEQAIAKGFRWSGRNGFVVVSDVMPPEGWLIDAGATPVELELPGGIAHVTLDATGAVIPVGSDFDFTAHETGHMLGLDHSFGFPQLIAKWAVPGEYQHFWCIMSAQTYGESHPQFDPPTKPPPALGGPLHGVRHARLDRELCNKGPGLNGGTRAALGWATPIDVDLEPGLDQSFVIHSLGSPGGDERYNSIRLRAAPGESYEIEFRSPADEYDRGVLCPMVVINGVEGSLADGTYPNGHAATYLGEIQAPLAANPFAGPGFHVQLENISADGKLATIRIRQVTGSVWIPAVLPARVVSVYACETDGDLLWYRHNGRDNGRSAWFGPRRVGTEWQQFKQIVTGGLGGIIYGVEPNGDLWWYCHIGRREGTTQWSKPVKVGNGWDRFTTVLATDERAVYGIEENGDLLWYRHNGRYGGTTDWTVPQKVGNGWDKFSTVLTAAGGVFYGIEPNGDLWWYRHDGYTDGTWRWSGPVKVGIGWDIFERVFTGASGLIYGI